MNILEDTIQGTEKWLSIRSKHFTASEAPAAFGVSKYLDRNELLRQKSTGVSKDLSEGKQALFDKGHLSEAMSRSIAEEIIGGDLYPVTANMHVEGLSLLASYDGVSFDKTIIWEHKLWSESLAKQVKERSLEPHYSIQLDQQLLISGAEKCLFMTSDGTKDNCAWMWYETSEEKKAVLVSTWQQFKKDLANYQHKEHEEKPIPEAIMQLPSLSIQIKGEVTVSNLPEFKQAADIFIANINTDLSTDEDFAVAEATVKFCDETEKKLEYAKAAAIGQTASINELMNTIDFIKESIRTKRLTLEKLVKSQKENIKTQIVLDGFNLCFSHATATDLEFPQINFMTIAGSVFSRQNFEAVCKNKRTLTSLHNAVDTEVASIKIKLNDLAMIIRKNLSHLPDDLSLFRDLQSIITKHEDDFKLLVESRLAEQKRKEEEAALRAAAEVKAAEERGRAQALAAQERERIAAEQEQRRIAEASERMRQQKESETKRIESLPTDIKSVLADEKKQAELIALGINDSQDKLIGFKKWWSDVGKNITGDRMFLAESAWESAKNESAK